MTPRTPHPPLQPSLWRTCRVLANRQRLRIFQRLLEQPGQTVSEIARRLKLRLPVASDYLRLLESRSLLTARRTGKTVTYRIRSASSKTPVAPLLRALKRIFEQDSKAIESLFHLCTAFTHPRRIEIYQALSAGVQTAGQLRVKRRISAQALARHLQKLEARGFIGLRSGIYKVRRPRGEFGRALAGLALRSP